MPPLPTAAAAAPPSPPREPELAEPPRTKAPSAAEESKAKLQDIMAKKEVEWDRMMGTAKDEDRAKSLDLFRKLSDEEVDLANSSVTKSRLKDFVDLKVQYFDKLTTETDPKRRREDLEKFRDICEREMYLAKTTGPRRLLEVIEAEAKLAKKRLEEGLEEEDKKKEEQGKKEEHDKKKEEHEEKKGKNMHFNFSYSGNGAVQYGSPKRKDSRTDVPKEKEKSKRVDQPTDSDIDKKLKLLSHLESARVVLQNRPLDSSSSMADEVRNRLRKVNLLQMKLVDEILDGKIGLDSEIPSGKREREKPDDFRRGKDDDIKGKAKKTKLLKGGKKIVVAHTDSSDSDIHVASTSITTVEEPQEDVYAKTAQRRRAREEPPAPAPWERPERDTKPRARERFEGPPDNRYDYQNYGPPQIQQHQMQFEVPAQIAAQMPHVHCAHFIDVYPEQISSTYDPGPADPKEVYPQPSNFPNPEFPMQQSDFPPPPPCFPVEFEIRAQGSFSFSREVNDVGVDAGSLFSGDNDEALDPPGISETTMVVRYPEQAVQTEPGPMVQQSEQAPGERVVTVHVTDGWAQTRPPRAKPDASNEKDFARNCHESLKRIADSVDNILSELSSRQPNSPRSRGQQRRRGRREEEDFDDPDSGADGQDGPAFWSQLCQNVLRIRGKSPSKQSQNDVQLTQLADRIHKIVQKVITTSKDVIGTRETIQQGGMEGNVVRENVLAAEDKLWELIDLEKQLADKLAEYRRLDDTSSRAFSDSISQAEEKIKRLIQVETKLAAEIADWRKSSPRKATQRSPPKGVLRRTTSASAVAYESNDDDGSSVTAICVSVSSSSSIG